jgi:ubiquinone/menaquinone biosynthesis C-methylase UbiE
MMNDSDVQATITAAAAYEELFVPALFQQWTDYVLDSARVQKGQRVLDVACGTGVLTRQAAARVGENGFVAGLDPNPGMLAVAEQISPGIEWRQGTAESIPYPDNSFDTVVSQFGLMFFSDQAQALSEMMRVLSPGGRMAVAVWDSMERNQAYAAEFELVRKLAGETAAAPLQAPFVLGDPEALAALASRASATPPSIASYRGTACFPSLSSMLDADILGWLPLMGVNLSEEQIQAIQKEAEQVLGDYVTDKGTMEFDLAAHILTVGKAAPSAQDLE